MPSLAALQLITPTTFIFFFTFISALFAANKEYSAKQQSGTSKEKNMIYSSWNLKELTELHDNLWWILMA